jgi:hypothetical protein
MQNITNWKKSIPAPHFVFFHYVNNSGSAVWPCLNLPHPHLGGRKFTDWLVIGWLVGWLVS